MSKTMEANTEGVRSVAFLHRSGQKSLTQGKRPATKLAARRGENIGVQLFGAVLRFMKTGLHSFIENKPVQSLRL